MELKEIFVALFRFFATSLAAGMVVISLLAVTLFSATPDAEAQDARIAPAIQTPSVFSGSTEQSQPVFVPARPRMIEVGPDGEITRDTRVTTNETEPTERTVRVHSISDLAGLTDEQIRQIQRDGTRIDVNPFRIRDDVNAGLFRLADQIRSIDFTIQVSGVRNGSGTAATGGTGYSDPRVRQDRRR